MVTRRAAVARTQARPRLRTNPNEQRACAVGARSCSKVVRSPVQGVRLLFGRQREFGRGRLRSRPALRHRFKAGVETHALRTVDAVIAK